MDSVSLIKERLQTNLAPMNLEIRDDSDLHAGHAGAASGGGHFTITVISSKFEGKPMVERHRMVYQAVSDLMHKQIHALSIQARTPEEHSSVR